MAQGKNKKLGKKGAKRKIVDPFSKKDWYDVKAPSALFPRKPDIGKTIVTRSSGQKNCNDSLINRVFEVSLGDLKDGGEDESYRKFRFRVEDIQGKTCLTNFYGLNFTTDKLRSLVRKWHTLIEARTDIKTTDGYILRLFSIGFTQRHQQQTRKTSYAQSSQVRSLRAKMIQVMQREASGIELKDLVVKLIPEIIGKEMEKACAAIYPLQNVFIRKVKVLRSPKTDLVKLAELHGGASAVEQLGKPVDRPMEDE